MRVQLRIVAGQFRGRKLFTSSTPELRPTPQMVREALFSILGNAVPGRLFVDLFAGSGINGLEALSRGASSAIFIERDFRLAGDIEKLLRTFDVRNRARLFRTDAYRWAEFWKPPAEPVNIFISPPFADLEKRTPDLLKMLGHLQAKVPAHSVIVLQSEKGSALDNVALFTDWERRHYGRNELLLWQKVEDGVQGSEAQDEEIQANTEL